MSDATWTPPASGYTTTPNCPGCGAPITLPPGPMKDLELGPCGTCGDELVGRRDAMGLMVKGGMWRDRVDAAIAAEVAARAACPSCRRLIKRTADGERIAEHNLLQNGRTPKPDQVKRCPGSGAIAIKPPDPAPITEAA